MFQVELRLPMTQCIITALNVKILPEKLFHHSKGFFYLENSIQTQRSSYSNVTILNAFSRILLSQKKLRLDQAIFTPFGGCRAPSMNMTLLVTVLSGSFQVMFLLAFG